ncbi:MAG: dynamin [Gaiellales bacterium]|nr:dynamin [Gaiellales bacterium]
MPKKILTESHEALLAEERQLLGELQVILARHDAAREDQTTLERSIRRLDELFLLVVAGEFNSGKSAFINALLGSRLLEEGVTPTTSRIHLLGYGETSTVEVGADGVQRVKAPVDLLREVEIVDTPGTNALDREHEAITQQYIPRSDLVLFVTSADRTFTESERAFIEQIRSWGKKLVFVVNKVDILRSEGEREQIERFVIESAQRLLGFSPSVFSLSAREALEAKLAGEDGGELLEKSRFPALEGYLVDTLDDAERVRLKLLNPLGVALNLVDSYQTAVQGRLDILVDDFSALDGIEHQLDLYKEDLGREFRFRLSDVDNVLHELEERGQEFLDDTVRLGRIFDLARKTRVKEEFERKVVLDAPEEIEQKVGQIIDWMVSAELRQWQALSRHVAERQAHHADRVMGTIGTFDQDRRQLLDTLGRAAQRTVETYDPEAEADRLADSVQNSVAGLAVIEVGAIGLGALVAALATTTLVDVTGILAASFVAVMGLFVIPARRAKAKGELAQKIAELRTRLMGALIEQFEQESQRSLLRIREAVAPYTRFVRAERERLQNMRDQVQEVSMRLGALRRRLEGGDVGSGGPTA